MEYSAGSLAEHLLDQLHGYPGGTSAISRGSIAETLDETGYLTVAAERHRRGRPARPPSWSKQALAIVQALDPPGVGARSLAECLALQAKAADRYDPAMARLIDNLDLLAKGRIADLKRICGVDDEDLADMIRELRAYDPKPGCRFSGTAAEDVTPDVFVRTTRAGYAVELNQATLPRLLVNRRYYQELKSGPQDKASRAWLSECLQSANWLVKALDQRARTIVKVVSRDRQAPAGLLRARRGGDEADDPARSRRGDRDARIDGQPGDLEQISAVRPRALRAQIFLWLGRRLGRGRGGGGGSGQGRHQRIYRRRDARSSATTRSRRC